MSTRPPFTTVLLLLLALTLLLAGAPGRATGERDPVAPASCTVHELGRRPLALRGGGLLYVEPLVLERAAGGAILLAGAHNHLFRPLPAGGWKAAGGPDILGAVIDGDDVAVVPSPIPGRRFASVRAAARAGGGWSVAFVEVTPTKEPDISVPDTLVALWHGVLVGVRWVSLERLPLEGAQVQTWDPSRLVAWGDSLAWALVLTGERSAADVAVFVRGADGWSRETVPTQFGSEPNLAYAPGAGLVLSVVHPDVDLPVDGNSLFLYARRGSWRKMGKRVPSTKGQANDPDARFLGRNGVLTWRAEFRATGAIQERAMKGRIVDQTEPTIVIDEMVKREQWLPPLPLPDDTWAFVTDHRRPDDATEIRLTRLAGDSAQRLWVAPDSFASRITATSTDSGVLITGGLVNEEHTAVYSELIEIAVSCGRQSRPKAGARSRSRRGVPAPRSPPTTLRRGR